MSISSNIRNGMIGAGFLSSPKGNQPKQFSGKQHEYFDGETMTFIEQYAKYSSDFIVGQMEMVREDGSRYWRDVHIRFADVIKPSAAIQRNFDDYKIVLISDRDITCIPRGTKIVAMGSTWLSFNPMNMSSSDGSAVLRRCNTVWKHLDFYGNILNEPLIADKELANANDWDAQQLVNITRGYFNISAQYNEQTKQLGTNGRIMLGSSVYRITGYSDVWQDYTGDFDSVSILEFTARYEEPNSDLDDVENHIAGSKKFSWEIIEDESAHNMVSGMTKQIQITTKREDEIIVPTDEHPFSYRFESSNPEVVSVNESGTLTAIKDGEATIYMSLAQNEQIRADFSVTVGTGVNDVEFTSPVPEVIDSFKSATITAHYFENSEMTDEPVTFEISGAEVGKYASILEGNNGITITCYGGSVEDLVLTARHGEYSDTATIKLKGF